LWQSKRETSSCFNFTLLTWSEEWQTQPDPLSKT
jgi:hypothetical protein